MHDVEPRLYTTVIREMIRHENDVTNHRIMWLLIVQRLVANAYQFLFVIGLFLLGACTATRAHLRFVPGAAASDGVGSFQEPRPGA